MLAAAKATTILPSRSALLFAACTTVAPATAYAGAWAQPSRSAYTKLTYANLTSVGRYDADGNPLPSSYGGNSLFFYAEYGLLESLTVIASGPLAQFVSDAEPDYELDAKNAARVSTLLTGDFNLAAKFQYIGAPPIAIQVGMKIPLGYDNTKLLVPLGTQRFDVDVKLLAGASFYPIPLYVTGEVGYRMRGGPFDDELPMALEIGYFLLDTIYLQAFADGVYGLGDTQAAVGTGRFLTTEHRGRIGGGVLYPLPWVAGMDVNVTYLKSVFGRNTINAHEIYIGCAYKFSVGEAKQ